MPADAPFPPSSSDASGQVILLAEDSAAIRLLVRAHLTRWGFAVHAVPCDETAVQALRERSFDLAIIGATAPGAAALAAACDGIVPILALVTPGNTILGAAAEAALPIDPAALRRTIHGCLAQAIDADAIAGQWESPANPVFQRIARVFIAEVRSRLEILAPLIAAGDMRRIENEAHAIKGAAANVGLAAMRGAAAGLEAAAAQADSGAVARMDERLRTTTAEGLAALETLLRTNAPPE